MTANAKSRNSSIDILKLIFSIAIVLFHFGKHHGFNLVQGGYIFVEGFFMITGYFMMNSVSKAQNTDIGRDTLKFITHKYLSFAPMLIATALVAEAVTVFLYRGSLIGIFFDLLTLLTEIVPLQMTGIKNNAITAVSWYLSAMMLALLVLYPVARRTGSRFTRIICPLLAVMIYGIICKENGFLNTITGDYFILPIQSGIFRAVAGICTGCMLYDCVKATEKYKVTHFGEFCFLIAEFGSLAFIFFIACFFPESNYDFFTLPFFFILLYSCFGRKSVFSKRFSFSFTRHFSTASLLIYLNHNNWNYHMELFNRETAVGNFILYAIMITGSCVAVTILTQLLRYFWKKLKPFVKKHFVG